MAYFRQTENSLHSETEVTRLTVTFFRDTQEIILEYQTNIRNAVIRRCLIAPPRCSSDLGNRQFGNNSRKPMIERNKNRIKNQPRTA